MTKLCPMAWAILLVAACSLQGAPEWRNILKQDEAWYGSDEAREVARTIMAYQDATGGWAKNTDMTVPPPPDYFATRRAEHRPTIDNGATTTQLRFLARVAQGAVDEEVVAAVRRGLRYLLEARYPSGGWPQFYPLRPGYYTHITYNDNAMISVLEVLRDARAGQAEWAGLVDAEMADDIEEALYKGVACILATQVVVDGELTVWCAQHDAETLAPAPARKFEPISLSGAESVGVVRFLMQLPNPSARTVRAIEAAIKWFEATAIPGRRVERADGDQRLVADAKKDAWARFYEIGTNRPIFAGRDAVIHYDLSEVESERRAGYAYYGDWAMDLIQKEYPAWRRRLARRSEQPVLFIAGDSTAADKPRLTDPERGWGQALREFLLPGWHVDNRALNGRSTKSFIDEGHWAKLVADLRRDDWVIIQFGHNDEKIKSPERYADPHGAYRDNLMRFVGDVRERGAHPILATSVARRKWNEAGTELAPTHGDYPAVVRAVAAELDVPLLEMEQRTTELERSRGVEGSKALHLWYAAGELPTRPDGVSDDTHYSPVGARAVAKLAIEEMKNLDLPIAAGFADAVVATDGSGDFTAIEAAIYGARQARAEPGDAPRWIILVKPGVYRERVYVQQERGNIALIGENPVTTTLVEGIHANMTGPDGRKIGTFRTPTLHIDGPGFIVENLTIANDAGPVGQALALRVDADRVVFRNCRFLGWQDTILVNRGRHYFADCYVEGHVDFIFGAANAVFDRTHIHCVGNGYITAASTPWDQGHGLTFLDCVITGAEGVETYLGRPWRAHAATTFVRTEMSAVVRAEGWHNWNQPEREETSRYVELASRGPGANNAARVAWAQTLDNAEPVWTAGAILGGVDDWRIPSPIAR